jgi:hypothetical protein
VQSFIPCPARGDFTVFPELPIGATYSDADQIHGDRSGASESVAWSIIQ